MRQHHETAVQVALSAGQVLGYLAPAVVLVGRQTCKAIAAAVKRWREGEL